MACQTRRAPRPLIRLKPDSTSRPYTPPRRQPHRKSRCCLRGSPNTSFRRRLHQRRMSRCCTEAPLPRYTDSKRGVDVTAPVHAVTSVKDGALAVSWDDASIIDVEPDSLAPAAANPAARYGALPAAARNAKSYAKWTDDFEQWLVRAKPLRLYSAPAYKLSSRPGETEADFSARVQQAARERRDVAVEKLRGKYAARVRSEERR